MNVLQYVGVGVVALFIQHGVAHAGDISGAGSTFVAPVLSKWSSDYGARGEGLTYQRTGSGAGISSLRSGTVDFAATDAPLRPAELQRLGFLQFPLVVGGVVPIVNLDGVKPGDLRLTGAVLADIYLGKLAKWNDPKIAELNPGITLPAAPIIIAHRVDASGTTFNLTNYLSKVSAEWRSRVGEGLSVSWPSGVGGKGNDGVAAFVKQTRNSIGYVDFAYARRSQHGVCAHTEQSRQVCRSRHQILRSRDGCLGLEQRTGLLRRFHGSSRRRCLPDCSDVVCLDVCDTTRAFAHKGSRGLLPLGTAARAKPGHGTRLCRASTQCGLAG